jgi:biotin carboxylase
MNVLFLSPAFPPQFFRFCTALRAHGINVLGMGDTPPHELPHELHAALGEYVHVPDLDAHYDSALRATAHLISRHGRLARIESHNEHWLTLESRLREDFNVPGPRPETLARWRAKSSMGDLFAAADIPGPVGHVHTTEAGTRAFAKAQGYPLIFKPNTGVGAQRTFKVNDDVELEAVLKEPLTGYLVQPFIRGTIVSYDGLVDDAGHVVFETSHEYSSGIMEVVNQKLDFTYWNTRKIPAQLREYGRRALDTFGVRGRFFHIEFFRLDDGSHRALEINVRPPGGFTTDMMNYSADIDVYDVWARMVAGADLTGFRWTPKYHVLHASRRAGRRYQADFQALEAHLGERLLWHREVPGALAEAMGEYLVLVRHPDLAQVQADAAFIQQLAH